MTSRLSLSATVLLVFLALACSNSTEPNVAQEFPNAVGNLWVYAVHDTVDGTSRVDTARVRIVLRTYTISAGEPPDTARASRPAMVWEIELRGHVDSLLTIRHTNSVEVNPMTIDARWMYRRIRFPLAVGAEWDFPLGHDIVTARQSIDVPAGTFGEAWRVEGSQSGAVAVPRTYWFQTGVGLLALEQTWSGRRERWELVRYELM